MNLKVAAKMARDLMEDYDFAHWSFKFDRAKTRHGQCDYGKQEISLSRHFVELNQEWLVRETVLHEIAHAIAGSRAAHGPEWQNVARNLGVRPQACKPSNMPAAPWRLMCATGHDLGPRHRRSVKLDWHVCGRCSSPLRYVPAIAKVS